VSTRRTFFQLAAAVGDGGVIRWQLDPTQGLLFTASRALASVQTLQTRLPGDTIKQFVEPLTTFVGRRVSGSELEARMSEFQQHVLPDATYNGLPPQ
jgi:hypothetical protein